MNPGWEVGVRQERDAKGNGIESVVSQGCGGFLVRITHVADEDAVVMGADRGQELRRKSLGKAGPCSRRAASLWRRSAMIWFSS